MVGIGKFRRRVKIQQTTQTQDSTGAPLNAWADFATVWCSIEPLRGDELLAAQQVEAQLTTRIRTRYLSGVQAKMRVVSEDGSTRTWDIRSVSDVNDEHKELELMCVEVTS